MFLRNSRAKTSLNLKEKQAQLFGIVLQDNGYENDNPILGNKKGIAGNNSSHSSQYSSGNGGFHHGKEEDEENTYAVRGNPNNERDLCIFSLLHNMKFTLSCRSCTVRTEHLCEFILIAVRDLELQNVVRTIYSN